MSKGKGTALNHIRGTCYCNCTSVIKSLPAKELNVEEIEGVMHIVQEEKLARGVCAVFSRNYDLPIFSNISRSEERHMNAVKAIIDKYGLSDPTVGMVEGNFSDPDLQTLFNELTQKGSESLIEALKVGAMIEELDIKDLKERLEKTDNEDIKFVYEKLLNGSYNHLRAFVGVLQVIGEYCVPTYLSPEEFNDIILAK